MAKWIECTGSNEQIEALILAKTMVRVRYANRREVNWSCTLIRSESNARAVLQDAIAYLICQPHPYADLIKIWADTGCEVWVKEGKSHRQPFIYVTDKPDWNIPGAEYSFTPFDKDAKIKLKSRHIGLDSYDPSSPNGYD